LNFIYGIIKKEGRIGGKALNINRYINLFKRTVTIVLIVIIINTPILAFARAGGGGTSGGGNDLTRYDQNSSDNSDSENDNTANGILLGVFTIIAGGVLIHRKKRSDKRKAKRDIAINKLSRLDSNWNFEEIKKDIEEDFYKVQTAWMERDQDIAKEYMSDALYIKHKSQTDSMKARKLKNILEDMKLLEINPVVVQNYQKPEKDILWVQIVGKAIDYTIKEKTNRIKRGNKALCIQFDEYWKFIRKADRWVVDEIKQKEPKESSN
jgi:hypothetical protein